MDLKDPGWLIACSVFEFLFFEEKLRRRKQGQGKERKGKEGKGKERKGKKRNRN